mmetsp:Transcript_69636/g.175999  ORF Transcript_69636/g.175999 Transcript_69636/m.175999 type:complete len:280 (-) Transcript_69636:63-902(-)
MPISALPKLVRSFNNKGHIFSRAMRQDADATMHACSCSPRLPNILFILIALDSLDSAESPSSPPDFLCTTFMSSRSESLTLRCPRTLPRFSLSNTLVVKAHDRKSTGAEPRAMDCQRRTASNPPKPMRATIEPNREHVASTEKQEAQSSRRNLPSMILHPANQAPELQKAKAPKTKTRLVCPLAPLRQPAAATGARSNAVRNGRTPTTSTVTPLTALPKARMREPAARAALMLELSNCSTGSSASAPSRAIGIVKANISVNCGTQYVAWSLTDDDMAGG